MKKIEWNLEKGKALRSDLSRGVLGFEECLVAIEGGGILDVIPNPTKAHQRMFVLEIDSYAYVVPFVEDDEKIFLKTVYPSRKHTVKYLGQVKP